MVYVSEYKKEFQQSVFYMIIQGILLNSQLTYLEMTSICGGK